MCRISYEIWHMKAINIAYSGSCLLRMIVSRKVA
jgi:hypothetical protein